MESLRERFGKYHVLARIAQGGMAEVYKVKTVGIAGFEKVQALKRILPAQARSSRFIRSFIDEARIAVELNHRNIVQVFDFGKADGELYLAMELIEGIDLRTATQLAMTRGLPLPVPLACHVIAEVAAGLDYAHRKTDEQGRPLGIVHCDVSPANVMLSSDGYVKILDFGVARASFASDVDARRLRGKPRYMAPEQSHGEPPTPAADVFALAIVAWELVTGRPLFDGKDVPAILAAVRRAEAPRADVVNPQVPVVMADALAVALRREPPRRGTAADLLAAAARAAVGSGARALAAWLEELERRPTLPASAMGSGRARAASPELTPDTLAGQGGTRDVPALPALPAVPVRRADGPATRPIRRPIADEARLAAEARPVAGEPGLTSVLDGAVHGMVNDEAGPTRAPVAGEGAGIERTAPVEAPGETRAPAGDGEEPTATRGMDGAPIAPVLFEETAPARIARGAVNDVGDGDGDGIGLGTGDRSQVGLDADGYDDDAGTGVGPDRADHDAYTDGYDEDDDPDAFLDEPWLGPAASTSVDPRPLLPEELLDDLDDHAGDLDDVLAAGDDLADALGGPAGAGPADEAIDDDLGPPLPGGLPERRRAVVVAVAVESPGDARPVVIALGDLAYKRAGVVVDVDDHGVVVAFGMEIAGEDDVAIAMAYALDAATAGRELDPQATVRIGGRAGVQAPVGLDAGGRRIPEDAVDEARALARDAQPGRPLFAGGAGRLSSAHFAFRELAPRRHLHHRGRVLELLGPRSFDERGRALLDRHGRFVGRGAELDALDQAAARARAGDVRVAVLVRGRAGTGKSRLVAETAARLAAAPWSPLLVSMQASPAAHLAPFALVIDLLQAALDLAPGRGREARAQLIARLRHALARGGIPAITVAEVATTVDRAVALRDGAALGPSQAADLRDRIAMAIATFRTALRATGRPLVTIVEDLHLADAASLDVVRLVLSAPAPGAELLLATARPELPSDRDDGEPRGFDTIIDLDDLTGDALRELVVDRLGGDATPAAVAAVIQRAGGNPLFVEEVAAAVREIGPSVPATARDVLAARIDRLAPAAKTALQYAAVLGGAVRARLLDELVGGELVDALEELTAEGLLVRTDHAAPEAAEGELAFARGLIREVVLDALPARARRDAHARIGALLASRFHAGRDEPPAVIAEHLDRGGQIAGAAAFWLRAGRLALSAFDARGALAHLAKTLAAEAQLGAEPPTPASRARRRAALAGRDDARRVLGDLGDDGGDLDELARLAGDDPARLADVELRSGERLARRGDPGALVAIDRAMLLARHARDPRIRGQALRLRGEALARQGRFSEARLALDQARAVFRRIGASVEHTAAMVSDAHVLVAQGRADEAARACAAIAASLGDRGTAALARLVPGLEAEIGLARGDLATAHAAAHRAVDLWRRHGDGAREGDALILLGTVLDELGLHEDAASALAEGLGLLARSGARFSSALGLVRAGVNQARRGGDGHDTCLFALDQALELADSLHARAVIVEVRLARAEARLRRGPCDAAAGDAAEALRIASAAAMPGAELRALALRAEALRRLGRTGEAHAASARAVALLDRQPAPPRVEALVLSTHARVLASVGHGDRARAVWARARQVVAQAVEALPDEAWREAYARIEENREILEEGP